MPLSVALLGAFVLEAVIFAPYGAHAIDASADDIEWLATKLSELPGVGFRMPGLPIRLFVGNGALAVVLQNEPETLDVYVGALSDRAVQFLAERRSAWGWAAF